MVVAGLEETCPCLEQSGPLARSCFYCNKEDIERTKGTLEKFYLEK